MRTLRSALGPLPRTPVQSRFTEAIVVLGAGLGPRGKPTPGLVSRLETTLRLAQRSPRAAVVLSGGGAGILPEADVMARWLVERG
ncbi:MAG: YdcF family protein, partial [Myxococcota bacterium]